MSVLVICHSSTMPLLPLPPPPFGDPFSGIPLTMDQTLQVWLTELLAPANLTDTKRLM